MGYIENNLMKDEELIFSTKLHPGIYAGPATLILVGVALFLGSGSLGTVVTTLGLLWFLRAWSRRKSSEFCITNKRVIAKTGILSTRTVELHLSKIEGASIIQFFAGKSWGYGTVTLRGTGGSQLQLKDIAAPFDFRKHVEAHLVGP